MRSCDLIIRHVLAPVLVTPPIGDVVSVADVKTFGHIDGSGDDTRIAALLSAAIAALDGWSGTLGRCLLNQTWRATYDRFGALGLRLPLLPAASIASVKYCDPAGTLQTLSSANYRLLTDAIGPYVALTPNMSWPAHQTRTDAILVEFVAGYGTASSNVPSPIREAIMVDVMQKFDDGDLETAGRCIESLLSPFRAKRI